jgi:protein-tyrosine kinase
MEALYQSLESALPGVIGKIVLFSASRGGEGTTTLVREFAMTLSLVYNASVLVVDANPNHDATRAFGVEGALSLNDLLHNLLPRDSAHAKQAGVTVAHFDAEVGKSPGGQGISGANLDYALRKYFDYILFDAPALGTTVIGVSLARNVDGVVIVVDSERTRWPVVENTKKTYESTGAKVLGVILNRRAFYIPNWIYKWL